MTSLATACFLIVILSMIDAQDRRKARSKFTGSDRVWLRVAVNWILFCLGFVLLVAGWGLERAIAVLLLLFSLAGAMAIPIRRILQQHQHLVSGILIGFLALLAVVEWLAMEV